MDLFGTAGVRGPVTATVTPELAVRFGHAVASVLGAPETPVVVGRDGRATGLALADAVTAGLLGGGVSVTELGVATTPLVAFASRDGVGVMVTASHNPPADNGLKLFVDGRGADRSIERAVAAEMAETPVPARWDRWGHATADTVQRSYLRAIDRYTRDLGTDPEGLSVCLDAGCGTGAMTTAPALRAAGAEVVVLNGQVDGHFPARPSKPTATTLETLSGVLRAGAFDLGIAHDGDADRVVFLAPDGGVIHEDTVLAIIASALIDHSVITDPVVVTTPNASSRIDSAVSAAGGRTDRVDLGDLQSGLAAHGDAVVFAAEPWKHIHPQLGGWIDGTASAVLLTRLVAAVGLGHLLDPIEELPYRKVSIDCPDARKSSVMQTLTAAASSRFPAAEITEEHGVRLEFADGAWALVRPSGTEPKLRVYAEAADVDEIVDSLCDLLEQVI
jgi:phosphomannomutase